MDAWYKFCDHFNIGINGMKKNAIEVALGFLTKEIEGQRNNLTTELQDQKKLFRDHIDKEDARDAKYQKWQRDVGFKLGHCPESQHIKEQNGTISKLYNEVRNTSGKVSLWCYIFAALIASLTIGIFVSSVFNRNVETKPNNVKETVERTNKKIIDAIDELKELFEKGS